MISKESVAVCRSSTCRISTLSLWITGFHFKCSINLFEGIKWAWNPIAIDTGKSTICSSKNSCHLRVDWVLYGKVNLAWPVQSWHKIINVMQFSLFLLIQSTFWEYRPPSIKILKDKPFKEKVDLHERLSSVLFFIGSIMWHFLSHTEFPSQHCRGQWQIQLTSYTLEQVSWKNYYFYKATKLSWVF